ncbi:MAG: MliC family protein [Desulfobulbaceae bacterium]|jgi:membrane-bound inhibitor of C-type lysozyme|nr:MliC family protein [Desulfobulbaceae bacterium]
MSQRCLVFLLAAGLLVSCAPSVEHGDDQAQAVDAMISYQCESGRRIVASYPEGGDRATVFYQGKTLRLTRAVAASGARYVGDGHEWWGKGDDASLFQGEEGDVLLESCRVAEKADR